MTADEIKSEIASGNICAISLDTSAFGNPSDMSLEHGLIGRLNQFCGTGVRLLMSDVVLNEVETHMAKGASDSLNQLEKSLKAIGGSWNVSREARGSSKQALIGSETPKEHASRRVKRFVERNECLILKVEDHIVIEELMRRYFSFEPPFAERESKKNEFPDALAVMSLNAWAEKSDSKILVVSNDDDWLRYCDDASRLIAVRSLTEALTLFNANAEVACGELSRLLVSGEREEWHGVIRQAAQSHVDSMWFMAEADSMFYFDDEINEVIVTDVVMPVESLTLKPVSSGENGLVAELMVLVELEASCDFSFSVRDSIDKDYVYMGSTTATATDSIRLRMLITFAGDVPNDVEIYDIEIEGGNRHYFSFGTVSPDWADESSGYDE